MVENLEHYQRTKHIDVQYHYIRHLVSTKRVEIEYCPIDEIAADALTKPLARTKLLQYLQLMLRALDTE